MAQQIRLRGEACGSGNSTGRFEIAHVFRGIGAVSREVNLASGGSTAHKAAQDQQIIRAANTWTVWVRMARDLTQSS